MNDNDFSHNINGNLSQEPDTPQNVPIQQPVVVSDPSTPASAPQPSQPIDSIASTHDKTSKTYKIVAIICAAIVCAAVIGLVIFAIAKNNLITTISDNIYAENYEGNTYYIYKNNYTGEYDLQEGNFLKSTTQSDGSIKYDTRDDIDDFDTQEIMTFKEYVNFCEKWDLVQRYHDSGKNYITIAYAAPGSAYIDVNLADVIVDASNADVYLYDYSAGVVADVPYYALFIPVDRDVTSLNVVPVVTEAHMQDVKNSNGERAERPVRVDKPIIYLYPTTDTEVSVELGYPDKLTAVYPTYGNGWQVLAHPDGVLQDLKTGRELYSLYYESKAVIDFDHTSEGFVVQGNDSASFLEDKLEILGLTPREAEEFIVYWLPKLESSPYNFIRFATAEEIDTNMPLSITPSPDSIIRVLMVFKPLQSPIEVKEQQLSAPARNGFTVVEWGGVELSNSLMH